MFTLYKCFALTLIVSLAAIVSCSSDAVEVAEIQKNIVDTNPTKIAILTQLKSVESDSNYTAYTYKCTMGSYSSNRLACTSHENNYWSTPHDMQLNMRCPLSGSGPILSYVETIYKVSMPSVNCYVYEGGVGLGYIGVTVNAWNTLIFNYTANFFT